ncbi:MAG: hypothetical protein V4555_21780 [Acidobacteriota bacterium]
MRYRAVAGILVGACAFWGGCAAGAETWTEIKSPHFRVLTNGSAGDGRKVANEFEQMRFVFVSRFPGMELEAAAPLTILAVRDQNTLKALEPRAWKASHGMLAGQFSTGWETRFAVVRLDTWGESNAVVVYHEYTHSVMHRFFHWMPVWLDEGMAEFYAYTWFQDDKILIGAPSQRSGALQQRPLFPVARMLEVTSGSKEYRDAATADLFYAESWAMVHYMMFAPGMGQGVKLDAFLHKIGNDEPQVQAFREVFGDPKNFDESFYLYTRQPAFAAGTLAPDKGLAPKTFAERKMTQAEVDYETGCFSERAGEQAVARASIEKAIAEDPTMAAAVEELAYMDYQMGHDDAAEKGWEAALKLDPDRWRSLFALTMARTGTTLLEETRDEQRLVLNALRKVTAIEPKYAPAYVEEALLEWKLGALELAYRDARKAEALEPWRAGYHLLTAQILLEGKQAPVAAQYARYVAEHWTGPDHNEAVQIWRQIPAASQGTEAAPEWDFPKGATVAEGELEDLTCATGTVVVFRPDGAKDAEPLRLKTGGPLMVGFSDTFWWGEDHYTMCHHLTPHRAIVAYDAATGVALDVEVRDDRPAMTVSAPASAQASGAAH